MKNKKSKLGEINLRQKKGLTLIELVAIIVILGIGIVSMVNLLSEIAIRVRFSEDTTLGSFYAQEMMEKIHSKNFTEIDALVGTGYPESRYERNVNITYCELNGDTWQSTLDITDYKMVTVTVARKGASGSAGMSTVISKH
ncbi:MAG: hypothetical protein ABH872_03040 [Candidatus Omnitrophota bacterium]